MSNYKFKQKGRQLQAIIDKAEKLPDVVGYEDVGKYLRVDYDGRFVAEQGEGGGGGSGTTIYMETVTTGSWTTISMGRYSWTTTINNVQNLSGTNVRIYNVSNSPMFYTYGIVLGYVNVTAGSITLYAETDPGPIQIGIETYVVQNRGGGLIAPSIYLDNTTLHITPNGQLPESGLYEIGRTVGSDPYIDNYSIPYTTEISIFNINPSWTWNEPFYTLRVKVLDNSTSQESDWSNSVSYSSGGGSLEPPSLSIDGNILHIQAASGTPPTASYEISYKTNPDDPDYTPLAKGLSSTDTSIDLWDYENLALGNYYLYARANQQGSYGEYSSPAYYTKQLGLRYGTKLTLDGNNAITLDSETYTYLGVDPVVAYYDKTQSGIATTQLNINSNLFTLDNINYEIDESAPYLINSNYQPAATYIPNSSGKFEITCSTEYTLDTSTPSISYIDISGTTRTVTLTEDPQGSSKYPFTITNPGGSTTTYTLDLTGSPYISGGGKSISIIDNKFTIENGLIQCTLNTSSPRSISYTDQIGTTGSISENADAFIIFGERYSLSYGLVINTNNSADVYPLQRGATPLQFNSILSFEKNSITYYICPYGGFKANSNTIYPIIMNYNNQEEYAYFGNGSYGLYRVKYSETSGTKTLYCLTNRLLYSTVWDDLLKVDPDSGHAPIEIDSSDGHLTINSNYLPVIDQGDCYYELYIPNTVTTIVNDNFNGCNVQELNFVANISTIGSNAFANSDVINAYVNYHYEGHQFVKTRIYPQNQN